MNGIWIRSQSRRALVFATAIYLDNNALNKIQCDSVDGTGSFNIGTYLDQSRALEVLDMIAGYVNFIDDPAERARRNVIYQMPAE